jgi:(2Fe-2S) ferredoxin
MGLKGHQSNKNWTLYNDGQYFGSVAVEIGQELVDGHQQGDNAVKQVIMSDLAAQMFPEPLDQVELGRVGRQRHYFQAIRVLSQHSDGLL